LVLPEGVTLLSRTATSLKVRVERPQVSNPIMLQALSALGAPLLAFQEQARTLEQVYLKVMADAKGSDHVQ